jgi:hypothetical protein
MRFDTPSAVDEVIRLMRESDTVLSSDRAVLLRLYNGNPPFDATTAKENNIQENSNDLAGPNLLSMARRQWNNAFLKPSHYFTATADRGPGHKRAEWSQIFTKQANRVLKRDRSMIGQIRATGANTLLFGPGPVNWKDRRTVIPNPIPVSSLLIPNDTEIDDWENTLSEFAIKRKYSAAQLWDLTHGTKVDPGWNQDMVKSQVEYLKEQVLSGSSADFLDEMPEEIEELMNKEKGLMGSGTTSKCSVYDFYFREAEDGTGWYRRIILDSAHSRESNKDGKAQFLYTSGSRKYASSVSEIIHCQFGDCSPYAPFKYHSIRSLGWMLWGVCDLQNRLHCKFNEALFEQLMWFFQTASNQDLVRLKKANFEHMGVIPQGIKFLTANERFTPNFQLVQMGFARNRQLMSDSATTYTQEYDKGNEGEARTATETMAIVNSSQALASGILEMAYTYETFKYREMVRRLCLKHSTDKLAREFRLNCLTDGVPEDMLDADKWNIEPEKVVGGGNKTVQMATVGFLNQIRKNLPPNGQRLVDHISVEAATDQPDLAEEMAPIGQDNPISNSMHDAQGATTRILRGLPFAPPKDAVHEDYVTVWLRDLGLEIQRAIKRGGVKDADELNGLMSLANEIGKMLAIMAGPEIDPEERAKVRRFEELFGQLQNHLKGLAQRLQETMQQQAENNGGQNGGDPKDAAKVQAMLIQAQTKAKIAETSAAQRTAQKEEQFQKGEARKDQQTAAEIARTGVKTRHELMGNRLRTIEELNNQPEEPAATEPTE